MTCQGTRGYAVIVRNKRKGADNDVTELKQTWASMNYTVKIWNDMDSQVNVKMAIVISLKLFYYKMI